MSSNTNTGWSLTEGHQHLRLVLRALLNKEQHKPVLTMFLCIVAMKSWVGFFCIWLSLTSDSISNMRIINFHVLFDKNKFNILKLMAGSGYLVWSP